MIYAEASRVRLACVRIVVFGIWLVAIALDPFTDLAVLLREWFVAQGLWALLGPDVLELLWNAQVLGALKALTLGTVFLALIGAPAYRVWSASAAVLLVLVQAFVRGFGHTNHAQIQLVFVTCAIVFLPVCEALCLSRPKARAASGAVRASFVALALVFAFPYFATGLYRLAHAGGAIYFGVSMLNFVAHDALSAPHFGLRHGLALLDTPLAMPLLNAGFVLVTAAELALPWAHFRRTLTLACLAILIPFHLVAPLLMDVIFAENLLLIAVLYAWPLLWSPATANGG